MYTYGFMDRKYDKKYAVISVMILREYQDKKYILIYGR
jgi:hypothetical protein